ncbi:hypothetical protein EX895_003047 [Sporisorium graminicola]|uniref:YDG domain-containing protein n=1 Tax=Sporisorium graminicola TaxID=280036 RepID=A0A4U7KTT3_9BASI|nr:hypothetical protein EX895_003047 [Sporisorium graminicola]TKY87951.1 hypothetical protein EX895_003047 [Sporisorium graminicola]
MVRRNTNIDMLDEDASREYEEQRQANIKANLELIMSLGLYQGSKLLKPKPSSTPKSKTKKGASPAAAFSASAGDEEFATPGGKAVERPRRITRSVSGTLSTPKRSSRGLKRGLSDDHVHHITARKTARFGADDFDAGSASSSSTSDDEASPSRPRRRHRRSAGNISLNPDHRHRQLTDLQRRADRLGKRIHDPKTFGHIPGIPIGTQWEKRMDCSTDAVHAPTVAGISGNEADGCWSICLSGGYEDDIDLGESFTYTGSGGRDLKGTANNPKNLRTAPQSSDQKWDGKNAALRRSVETKKPVRVVRGWKAGGRYAPSEGYVYCGLYRVERAWRESGASGWLVCKFHFVRLKGQAALPTFDHDDVDDEKDHDQNENEDAPDTQTSAEDAPPSAAIVTIDLPLALPPSPSPSPSRSPAPVSPHPILRSPAFDRTSYIILSDDENDEAEEVEHTLLQLELDPPAKKLLIEKAAPTPRRSSRKSIRRRAS